MDKKRPILPEEIEQAFREAHLLVLGADNEDDMSYALRKRAVIGDLMIRFCGYTPVELELILLEIGLILSGKGVERK